MKEATEYEKKALDEISAWKREKADLFTNIFELIGKPISFILGKLPGDIIEKANNGVAAFMETLKDASQWTYTEKDILAEAKKNEIEVDEIHELADQDLEKLDNIARSYFNSNTIIAALEGAGCGLGGLALIVADIPVLFGIAFRAVQQIGASYGLDMKDPDILPVVLIIFNAGSSASREVKTTAVEDMKMIAKAIAKNQSYIIVDSRTRTGVLVDMLKTSTKGLPKKIAENVTSRKLGQAIPIIGAGIGAGFNYWFLNNTVRAAFMLFRKLHIEKKYSSESKK